MKQGLVILCLLSAVKSGVMTSAADVEGSEKHSETRRRVKVDDLEGSETSAKLFNLASLFPSYSSYPSSRPGGYYPSSTGGSYYPSYTPTQGYYPNSGYYPSSYPSSGYYPSSGSYPTSGSYPSSGYYPTGTNVLGGGYGGYPTQSYYPNTGYVRSGSYGGYSGYGGYGGYGGNGGLNAYNGYDNPQYTGKRNLGFGYYSDTDRYGFYRSPTQKYSVNRGYN